MEIRTLIPDIQKLVVKKDGWFTPELSHDFANEIASRLESQLGKPHASGRLRLSQMGPRCPCALWYSFHHPELAERLPPWAEVKYAFGHIIEGLAISFAKAAGHSVVGEQDELWVNGVCGHRDAVIDGCVVDVKSASSIGFRKFQDGSIRNNDDFGYLEQLDGYILGSLHDPLVTVRDRGYLLAIDKQLGHMALYEHYLRETHIRKRIEDYRAIVALDRPPQCTCETVPDGKSGNIKLGTRASYNAFKHSCWPQLRTFIYASGPVYLTKVARKPDVIEVDRYGNIVYN